MATIIQWEGGALPTITGTNPTVIGEYMEFAAGSDANYASWSGLSANAWSARFYVVLPSSWTASSWSVMQVLTGGTVNVRANFGGTSAPGQVRLVRSANVQIANSINGAVATSTEYRFEIQVDRIAQTYRAAVFPLASDTALYDTGPMTGIDTGSAAATQFRLGMQGGAGVAFNAIRVGRIRVIDEVSMAGWIGRHASDTLNTGGNPSEDGPDILGLWNGNGVDNVQILGLWNGSGVDMVEPVLVVGDEIPTEPGTQTLIGTYNGTPSESPDEKTFADYGYWPQVASTYYQYDKPDLNMTYETARINRGTSPIITLTLRSGPTTLIDVADQTPAGVAIMNTYINALKTLSEVNPAIPVYATLDHEFEVKRNQGLLTGVSLTQYAEALSYFIQRCKTVAPLVQTIYWFGESDTTSIKTVLDNLTQDPHIYSADPYRWAWDAPGTTKDGSLGPIIPWIRGQKGSNIRFGISEFGTDIGFGDGPNAAWYNGLRDWLIDNNVEFACLFNRSNWNMDTQPLTKAAFAAELAH